MGKIHPWRVLVEGLAAESRLQGYTVIPPSENTDLLLQPHNNHCSSYCKIFLLILRKFRTRKQNVVKITNCSSKDRSFHGSNRES